MASGVFGLRKVYKKQVQNVTDNNLASWPEGATRGYYGGGWSPTAINTITRLDFLNETVSNPGNNLPSARYALAAVSNASYGYYGGGEPAYLCTITRLDFSNETTSDPGNNLPTGRNTLTASSSSSYGYYAGGFYDPPPGRINTITRLDFSNETVSDPGNNLPTARSGLAASSSSSYGYFGGGFSVPYINTITRLDFSNETASDPGNNLPTARTGLAAVSNASYGYYGGGTTPTIINTITKLDFTNETVSDPGNNLPTARSSLAATSSSSYGYYGGGEIATPPFIINTISKLDFFNETVSDPGNNFPTVRYNLAAVSGGASVARGKGYKTYGYVSTVTQYIRFDFLSETATDSSSASSPGSITSHGVGQISNNNYGYFAGNIPSITKDAERLDFSNETVSSMGEFLPVVMSNISPNVKSSNYGYQVGGFYPPSLEYSNVRRLEFSSEVFYDIPTVMPEKGRYSQNFSTQSYGYFMGGYYYDAPGDDWFTTISRLDFISETVSIIGSIGPTTCDGRTAVQNNLNGYVCGGSFPYIKEIYKMEFTTENVSAAGNMPYEISGAHGLPDTHYGYICGGWSPASPTSSNISKLDFSTEIVSGPTNKFPAGIRSANAGTPN